jgi:hypothetical protein
MNRLTASNCDCDFAEEALVYTARGGEAAHATKACVQASGSERCCTQAPVNSIKLRQ